MAYIPTKTGREKESELHKRVMSHCLIDEDGTAIRGGVDTVSCPDCQSSRLADGKPCPTCGAYLKPIAAARSYPCRFHPFVGYSRAEKYLWGYPVCGNHECGQLAEAEYRRVNHSTRKDVM